MVWAVQLNKLPQLMMFRPSKVINSDLIDHLQKAWPCALRTHTHTERKEKNHNWAKRRSSIVRPAITPEGSEPETLGVVCLSRGQGRGCQTTRNKSTARDMSSFARPMTVLSEFCLQRLRFAFYKHPNKSFYLDSLLQSK